MKVAQEQWTSKLESFGDAFPANFTGMRVLDVGCNEGIYSYLAAQRGASSVVGVDWDHRMVSLCRKRREDMPDSMKDRLRFYTAVPEGEVYDFILMAGVYHHLWRSSRDHYKLMYDMALSLADDGKVLLEVPANEDPIVKTMYPSGEWDLDEVTAAAEEFFVVDYFGSHGETRDLWLLTPK